MTRKQQRRQHQPSQPPNPRTIQANSSESRTSSIYILNYCRIHFISIHFISFRFVVFRFIFLFRFLLHISQFLVLLSHTLCWHSYTLISSICALTLCFVLSLWYYIILILCFFLVRMIFCILNHSLLSSNVKKKSPFRVCCIHLAYIWKNKEFLKDTDVCVRINRNTSKWYVETNEKHAKRIFFEMNLK